ncbi:signal transduction histidine kinase [Kribbella antiqua]|uniref:Signal transduction histidine kinase n=1 Tax=Kribbella antiqua TaxID=2512217 RepID=A0A4R2IPM9_9ACTN|nr:ATP-binding protein [Kribbella antiqua]TCO46867.1 signal transduction histidine kinase [Kribbella antiqua]
MTLSGQAGMRRTPATAEGVERTVVLAFVGIRTFDLGQTAIALSTGGLAASTAPRVDLAFVLVMTIESALLAGWLLSRGSVLPLRWPLVLDFALALGLILTSPTYVSPESRLVVWTMWVYPITLSTVTLIGGVLPRFGQVLLVSGLLALAYLAVAALPLGADDSGRATALANSLAYPGFATVAYVFCRFVRRLAAAADVARRRVAELERDRSRALVHDLLVYLELDRFVVADQQTQVAMMHQAREKHQQMRSYVDGVLLAQNVEERLTGVLRRHSSLAIRPVMEIAPETRLLSDVLEHLDRAMDTALTNVEQHAPGAAVLVSVRSDDSHVVVTIRDSGPGFDQSEFRTGYGISQILGHQLESVGGRSIVLSAPGEGTEISIAVPRQL